MTGREGPGPERPGPDYPPEWDDEPVDLYDGEDDHDDAHPVWVEGCPACVDRAEAIEQQRRPPTPAIVVTPDPWQSQGPVPPPPF